MSMRSLRAELPTDLLVNLTLREVRGKFKRSTLGWLWSVINPAVSLAIYTIVFGVFLGIAFEPGDPSGLDVYGFFLVCGLLPWNFLVSGLSGAAISLVFNEGLIKKVYFPRSVLPISVVLSAVASFGVELAVLTAALLVVGNMVLPWLPVVVVLVALLGIFTLGLGFGLAVANAYFRDVQHFLAIALNVWFYATPILYPLSQVPESKEVLGVDIAFRSIVAANPMHQFVDAFRDAMFHLRFPDPAQWLYLVVAAGVSLVLGFALFRRLEPDLAEEL